MTSSYEIQDGGSKTKVAIFALLTMPIASGHRWDVTEKFRVDISNRFRTVARFPTAK